MVITIHCCLSFRSMSPIIVIIVVIAIHCCFSFRSISPIIDYRGHNDTLLFLFQTNKPDYRDYRGHNCFSFRSISPIIVIIVIFVVITIHCCFSFRSALSQPLTARYVTVLPTATYQRICLCHITSLQASDMRNADC